MVPGRRIEVNLTANGEPDSPLELSRFPLHARSVVPADIDSAVVRVCTAGAARGVISKLAVGSARKIDRIEKSAEHIVIDEDVAQARCSADGGGSDGIQRRLHDVVSDL